MSSAAVPLRRLKCAPIVKQRSRRCVRVRAEASEETVRVRGKPQAVFNYISNLENMRQWYPGGWFGTDDAS